MSGRQRIAADCLASGNARAEAVVLTRPLSLWGGFDLETGTVLDVHHPQAGELLAGRVLVMPGGRGSSSSSSILLEAARLAVHPCAIVLSQADPILVIGALLASDLYRVEIPVVKVRPDVLDTFSSGQILSVHAEPGTCYIDCQQDFQ